MQSRVDELEFKVAYQEDNLQKLSDEFAKQQAELAQLKNIVKLLSKELENVKMTQNTPINSPNDEPPPPHY